MQIRQGLGPVEMVQESSEIIAGATTCRDHADLVPAISNRRTLIIIKRIVWAMEEYDRYKRVYYRKKKNKGGKDEAGEMALAT
ncbi:unnamed protein product [Brassica oleracea]